MNRYFVRMVERLPADTQERAAMALHRLKAIAYQAERLAVGEAVYAFWSGDDCSTAILSYATQSHEQLDWLIKRDPHFPYTRTEVIPTILTEALVREAQDFLGETIIPEADVGRLNFVTRAIEPQAEYWLAWKEVRPFSPLCPEGVQNDVHRRTVLAQDVHLDPIEFSDDNPVGRPIGILIAQAGLDRTRQHVEACDVFPDTDVTYTRLWTHEQAISITLAQLAAMRRPVPEGHVCGPRS